MSLAPVAAPTVPLSHYPTVPAARRRYPPHIDWDGGIAGTDPAPLPTYRTLALFARSNDFGRSPAARSNDFSRFLNLARPDRFSTQMGLTHACERAESRDNCQLIETRQVLSAKTRITAMTIHSFHNPGRSSFLAQSGPQSASEPLDRGPAEAILDLLNPAILKGAHT
jgi:hypothetical protein